MSRFATPSLAIAAVFVFGSLSYGQQRTGSPAVKLPKGVKTGVNTFVDKKRGTSVSVVIPEATQVYRGNLPRYIHPSARYGSYRQPYFYGYPIYRSTYPYPYRYTAPGVYYPGRGYYYGYRVAPGVGSTRVAPRTNSNNPFGGTSHYFGNPHASQYMGR